MTDAASKSTGAVESQTAERRTNVVLRSLVNEMLQRVRDLSRRTAVWSAEERAQAERELEVIMARVRDEAARSRVARS
ncbi:MAG TPA: hypothetical protein VLD17_17405 [Gemmatimonadaceae bacterium]|nr:hypothetical protein [Gemmatimonadaceae bacterium]